MTKGSIKINENALKSIWATEGAIYFCTQPSGINFICIFCFAMQLKSTLLWWETEMDCLVRCLFLWQWQLPHGSNKQCSPLTMLTVVTGQPVKTPGDQLNYNSLQVVRLANSVLKSILFHLERVMDKWNDKPTGPAGKLLENVKGKYWQAECIHCVQN